MKYREVLECVQPHVTAAVAVAALVAAAASAYSTSVAQKKAKRSAANASQLAAQGGTGTAPNSPTAGRFSKQLAEAGPDIEERLSSVLKSESEPAVPAPKAETTTVAPPIGGDVSGIQERLRQQEEERKRLMAMGVNRPVM